ncbi:hypothetical protein BSKO_06822 [Bryopsis sp. KO-2023]|nr:hypothetical protein BSKO_06822 [Bryopsis sp. KO-2023]
MAGRGGRRGGGRGGRGGRGMGLMPTALDEDGNKLTELIEGPPPDYPEVKRLPTSLPISDKYERLLDRWHTLRHAGQTGPFFIEDKKRKKDVGGFEVDRFSERVKKKVKRERLALGALITFSSYYFPTELSSEKQRKESRRLAKSSKALEAFWSNQSKEENEFEKFEELAAKGEAAEKAAEEQEDEEGQEEEEEESDEGDEGDDYLVGQDFDDDDGYGESDDGGDDEGIY